VTAALVTALVPCHLASPAPDLLRSLRAQLGGLLVVDDGMPPTAARRLADVARACGAAVLTLPRNLGKGHAVAAGIRSLLSAPRPPSAVLVVDADGQHPPEAVPAFLEASAQAELVLGDRFGDLEHMPLSRRLANRGASLLISAATARPVRDSQCGMRLLRGRALHEVAFPPGGYEAETRHLARCLRAGVAVAWVPIAARYGDEVSSFRPVRDSARIVVASFASPAVPGRRASALATRAREARAAPHPSTAAPRRSEG
jgi:glycosyltransferase involved in cell wall biosynthesis